MHMLCERNEEDGPGRRGSIEVIPHVPRVIDDTYDLKSSAVLRQVESEVLAYGIFAWFEEPFHKGFVHYNNVLRGGGVLLRDGAATENVLVHSFEIAGAHV